MTDQGILASRLTLSCDTLRALLFDTLAGEGRLSAGMPYDRTRTRGNLSFLI